MAGASFEIIDCHIHPAVGVEYWTGRHLPFRSGAAMVSDLRRAGITRACGTAIRKLALRDWSGVEQCNDATTAFGREVGEFFIPAIQINPHLPEASCVAIEKAHRAGVRWIGELVGYWFSYEDDYFPEGSAPVYDLAQSLGMVVNLHISDLACLGRLCEAFPRLAFVLAHPGDGRTFEERLQTIGRYPNLHLDLSGTGLFRYGMLRRAIDCVGAEKLLFGTDYPICAAACYVAGVLDEPLTDRERELIFAGNFRRIMRLA